MKMCVVLCAVFCAVLSAAGFANAPVAEKHEYIVSTEWLSTHIKDKNLVLLHVGSKEDYEKEHIPGAQYISTRDVSTTREENPLILELPPVERLKEKFESFGISNSSRVVIYWGKDWITPATRIFFTLDYIGMAGRTSILDGGMPAWKENGKGVTAEVGSPEKGSLTIEPRDVVVKQKELIDAISNNETVTIVDARSPNYYSGADKGSMPRGGQIPKAQNIPYTSFVTENNRFKSQEEIRALFDAVGAKKTVPIVTYCHIGQQASLAYFAARSLGYRVRVYDGSFDEWSKSKESVVVEKPASGANDEKN